MATAAVEIRKGHTVRLIPDAVKNIPAIHSIAVSGREFKVQSVGKRIKSGTRVIHVGPKLFFPASWFQRVIKS